MQSQVALLSQRHAAKSFATFAPGIQSVELALGKNLLLSCLKRGFMHGRRTRRSVDTGHGKLGRWLEATPPAWRNISTSRGSLVLVGDPYICVRTAGRHLGAMSDTARLQWNDLNKQTCPHCNGQLVEIHHYGERLVGCVNCNQWSWRGGKSLWRQGRY
jgi:hypothetical protein